MRLVQLSLWNFRNYERLDLQLPPGLVLFFGANAQGKTNLLEAIYLLAITKSFRASSEREVVRFNAPQQGPCAKITGIVEERGERIRIEVGFLWVPDQESPEGLPCHIQKQLRINGVPRLASEVVGQLNSILFTTQDIDLVLGPPSLRRRFLDTLLSQVDPSYLKALQRYQRVLHQRNQLLKRIREAKAKEEELVFWDQELVKEGKNIAERRLRAIEVLAPLATLIYQELARSEDGMGMAYASDINWEEASGDELWNTLEEQKKREIALGASLFGPHRDDLKLTLGGRGASLYASRGQARTMALALKLAEARFLAQERGREPVLLLDDALSELDRSHRSYVLHFISHYEQSLLTLTDPEQLPEGFPEGASTFLIKEGAVIPLSH